MAKTQFMDPAVLVELVEQLLDDPHGISTMAYAKLLVFVGGVNSERLNLMLLRIKATEGRFYLPEDWEAESRQDELKQRLKRVARHSHYWGNRRDDHG